MPRFGQHFDFLSIDALEELEMCVTELKVIQRKLHANKVQCQVERGKLAVVGRTLRPVIQLSEKTVHQTQCPLYLLIVTSFLRHNCSLPPWNEQVLLCLEISLFRVADEQFSHVVNYHANPLAVHDFEAADALEMPVTLLEGLEHLIGIARGLPTALLV